MGAGAAPADLPTPSPRRARLAAAGVGVAMAAGLTAAFARDVSGLTEQSHVLVAAGFVYLGAAVLGRPRLAWPLFAVTFVLIGISMAVPGFPASLLMIGIVALLALVAALRERDRGVPIAPSAAALVAIALAALLAWVAGQPLGGALIGLGLLANAAWDLRHLRSGRVVPAAFAALCAGLDAVLGIGVLVITTLGT